VAGSSQPRSFVWTTGFVLAGDSGGPRAGAGEGSGAGWGGAFFPEGSSLESVGGLFTPAMPPTGTRHIGVGGGGPTSLYASSLRAGIPLPGGPPGTFAGVQGGRPPSPRLLPAESPSRVREGHRPGPRPGAILGISKVCGRGMWVGGGRLHTRGGMKARPACPCPPLLGRQLPQDPRSGPEAPGP
jgi:hypothetical protein